MNTIDPSSYRQVHQSTRNALLFCLLQAWRCPTDRAPWGIQGSVSVRYHTVLMRIWVTVGLRNNEGAKNVRLQCRAGNLKVSIILDNFACIYFEAGTNTWAGPRLCTSKRSHPAKRTCLRFLVVLLECVSLYFCPVENLCLCQRKPEAVSTVGCDRRRGCWPSHYGYRWFSCQSNVTLFYRLQIVTLQQMFQSKFEYDTWVL